MINKTELLKKYADNLLKARDKNDYLRYARDFLDNTDSLSRESIEAYLESLRSKKWKPGTINFVFRVIRRLYAVNGMPWEYRRGEAPLIRQRDEYKPQLDVDVIKMMIDTARAGKLRTDETCFLALSTIYGLRREEMTNLEPRDINLRSNAIYIATIKNGRERYHMIPGEIKPYIAAHDFNQHYPTATLTQMFQRLLLKSGAGALRKRGIGWHSIRRAGFHGIIRNGLDPFSARKFYRWKSANADEDGLAMPLRYFGNVVVGLRGDEPFLEEAKGDEEVFEKHPFLPFWRE